MGDNYYPNGGLEDFVFSSDEIPTLLQRENSCGFGYLPLALLESNKLVYLDHPECDSPDWGWYYKDKIDPNQRYESRVSFATWYEAYDASDLSNLVNVEPKIVDISNEELKELQEKYTYTLK